jgi:hypothetical protein
MRLATLVGFAINFALPGFYQQTASDPGSVRGQLTNASYQMKGHDGANAS